MGSAKQSDIIARCAAELLRDDEFCSAFAVAYLPSVINQIYFGLVQNRPRPVPSTTSEPVKYQHRVADRLMTVEQLRKEIATEETPWVRWMFHEPNGTVVPLLEMTKPQLLRAVEEKKRQGDVAYKDAAFFRAIADTMDDRQTVADVWRANDLQTLYDGLTVKIKASMTLSPMLREGAAD